MPRRDILKSLSNLGKKKKKGNIIQPMQQEISTSHPQTLGESDSSNSKGIYRATEHPGHTFRYDPGTHKLEYFEGEETLYSTEVSEVDWYARPQYWVDVLDSVVSELLSVDNSAPMVDLDTEYDAGDSTYSESTQVDTHTSLVPFIVDITKFIEGEGVGSLYDGCTVATFRKEHIPGTGVVVHLNDMTLQIAVTIQGDISDYTINDIVDDLVSLLYYRSTKHWNFFKFFQEDGSSYEIDEQNDELHLYYTGDICVVTLSFLKV